MVLKLLYPEMLENVSVDSHTFRTRSARHPAGWLWPSQRLFSFLWSNKMHLYKKCACLLSSMLFTKTLKMKTNHTVRNQPWKRIDGGSIKGIWLLYSFTFVYAHFLLQWLGMLSNAAFPEASMLINNNMISDWSTLCLKNRLGAVRSSSVQHYKLDTLNPLERRAESFLEVWTLLASNILNLVEWAEEHPHFLPISAG